MRYPLPPRPVLSADGRLLLSGAGRQLDLIRTGDGRGRWLQLGHEARLLAAAPDGSLLAVADRHNLSLYELSGRRRWCVPLDQPPTCLAVSSSLVAAALQTAAAETTIMLFPVGAPEQPRPVDSGPYAAQRLALDATGRCLITGLVGPRAADGIGTPLQRLLSSDGAAILWEQSRLPFQPDAVLLSHSGRLLAHTRRRLLPADDPDTPPLLQDQHLETVAVSPNAAWAAWFWGRGPTAVTHLRVAPLSADASPHEGRYFDLGSFPTLAVDDQGCATLAFGRAPGRIQLLRLPPDTPLQEQQIQVHQPLPTS